MTDIADDDDNPEWTKADFVRAKAEEHRLPSEVQALIKRPRGRPKLERAKVDIKLRIDPDVLDAFKAGGPGWQTRMNEALRRAAKV